MHSVLAGAKICGTHRQALDDGLHLIQRQTINSIRIAITEGTGKIAFISQAEAKRETSERGALAFR